MTELLKINECCEYCVVRRRVSVPARSVPLVYEGYSAFFVGHVTLYPSMVVLVGCYTVESSFWSQPLQFWKPKKGGAACQDMYLREEYICRQGGPNQYLDAGYPTLPLPDQVPESGGPNKRFVARSFKVIRGKQKPPNNPPWIFTLEFRKITRCTK